MMPPLTIRRMRPGEELRLYEVLRASVLKGAASAYDDRQRRAWAPDQPPVAWGDRLRQQQVFLAEAEGQIFGFVGVTREGHLDLAYVQPDLIGHGIGSQLLERAETEMRLSDIGAMTCDASEIARPFLERHGWETLSQDTVTRNGVSMPRHRMRKVLD